MSLVPPVRALRADPRQKSCVESKPIPGSARVDAAGSGMDKNILRAGRNHPRAKCGDPWLHRRGALGAWTKTSGSVSMQSVQASRNQPLASLRALARHLQCLCHRRAAAMDNNSGSRASEQGVAACLLAYLLANPHACDTADGIRRWWLDGHEDVAMDELLRALERMTRAGLVEAVTAADGRRRYRRAGTDAAFAAWLAAQAQAG
jgi:Fe2+ or Zn2+ uptake regulation protein